MIKDGNAVSREMPTPMCGEAPCDYILERCSRVKSRKLHNRGGRRRERGGIYGDRTVKARGPTLLEDQAQQTHAFLTLVFHSPCSGANKGRGLVIRIHPNLAASGSRRLSVLYYDDFVRREVFKHSRQCIIYKITF